MLDPIHDELLSIVPPEERAAVRAYAKKLYEELDPAKTGKPYCVTRVAILLVAIQCVSSDLKEGGSVELNEKLRARWNMSLDLAYAIAWEGEHVQ